MMQVTNVGKVIFNQCSSIIGCYPNHAPQKTNAPYLVYNILNVNPDNIKGVVAPVDIVTVLIDIYSTTYSDCAARAILIRERLDQQHGTIDGVPVDRIQYITEGDDWEGGQKLFIKTIEYEFRIKNDGESEVIPNCTLSANYVFVAAIPAGYSLASVMTSNETLVTISIGTTLAGDDVMSAVDCEGYHTQTVDKWFSKTNAQTLYISSLDWTDTVEFYFLIEKIN